MKSRRILALVFALCLVLSLFSGCGQNNANSGTTNASASQGTQTGTGASQSTPAPQQQTEPADTNEPDEGAAPVEPDSPYHYAKGNYKADEKGLALEKYEYDLPITTTDEVLTYWLSCLTPQYLPEGGFGESELPQEVLKRTGVHIEYDVVASATMANTFAVMIASDDLDDIMSNARSYYGGAFRDAILEEGYFANLYDYREYMPNYVYEATYNMDDVTTYRSVFSEEDLIMNFLCLYKEAELNDLLFVRGDWLAKLGMKNTDLVTLDDWHNMLVGFKSQLDIEYPMTLYSTLEVGGCYHITCFDTYCYCYSVPRAMIDGGKVRMSNICEQDFNLMSKLNEWYNEGLINPNWASLTGCAMLNDDIKNSQVGFITGGGVSIAAHNDVIPADAPVGWQAMTNPLLYEGQTLHLGYSASRVNYGSTAISASCPNIELAVSWMDYRFSESGSFLYGYGIEGLTYEYREDGDLHITDYIVNHEAYWGMIMCMYALNHLAEGGLRISFYLKMDMNKEVPGFFELVMSTPHDDALTYPTAISLNAEQQEVVTSIGADLGTYVQENYLLFFDGSKPLSEWDSYVDGVYAVGMQEIIDVYQEAYDAFMA